MSNKKTAGILGAGISGLSIAYALKKHGIPVTIYEQNDEVGGVIKSHRKNGWLVESGPNTILVRNQKVWDLLDELHLTHQIEEADNNAKKRFVVRHGKLYAIPSSISRFLTTSLLSTAAKIRLLKEPFIAVSSKEDESIADFIIRRFGRELLDYGVNPFVAGVYAGDPEQLSIKHTFSALHKMEQERGSVAKGLLKKNRNKTKKTLLSFDDGMQVLPQRLRQKLGHPVKLNTKVKNARKTNTGWRVEIKTTDKPEFREHSAIVSTLPSYQLSNILERSKPVQQLTGIKYAPISVLALGFKKKQIDHPLDGFGLLIPEKESFNLLGCLFSSSLFPKRAPDGHALLTCFIGGTRHPNLADQPTDLLVSKSLQDLNQLLGINGKPVFTHHNFYPNAIPQFNMGYAKYLNTMEQIEQENHGFFIAGNFRSGVSVPDCILASFETAERVKMFVTNQ